MVIAAGPKSDRHGFLELDRHIRGDGATQQKSERFMIFAGLLVDQINTSSSIATRHRRATLQLHETRAVYSVRSERRWQSSAISGLYEDNKSTKSVYGSDKRF